MARSPRRMGSQRSYSHLDLLGAVRISTQSSCQPPCSYRYSQFFTFSVSRRLQRNFRALAESHNETLNSAGYEYVKMDVFLPVLNLPQKRIHTSIRYLSNVSIQGSFRFERRDYLRVYADLLVSLEGKHFGLLKWRRYLLFGPISSEDPQAWGYLPLTQPDSIYEVDKTAPLPPFQLQLIGNAGDPQVPRALTNIVRVHQDLNYDDFFSLIQGMDLALPAWATLEC